ncbi:cytochrome B6, partial [Sulfolobus sp. D5]
MKLYPKTTLGVALAYGIAGLVWLAVMGVAALWFRTILISPHTNPTLGYKVAPLYYFLVTMHGSTAMYIIVPDLALSLLAYSLYKSNMNVLSYKLVALSFYLINLPMIITFLGGPMTGWYMYPPLSLQLGSWLYFGSFAPSLAGKLIGLAYFMMFLNSIGVAIGSITMFIDGYKTRPKEGKIPIFAAYGMAFGGALVFITILALAAAELWYVLYFWASVPVNPLTWVVLFWFFGHPVVYYVPFAAFGGLYYFIPKFAGRQLYSERWARWNIALLFTFSMLAWVHHLQTWPLPVVLRAFITPTTLILAAGSGLTVLNLGLTILLGKGYEWKNPVGLTALIALLGFILAGLQALMLPINPLNVLVHNSYYVVGHFHLMIWTIIFLGYLTSFLGMLSERMGGISLSSLSTGLIGGGVIMWTIGAFLLGYTMSIAGYLGLLRRW